MDESKVGLSIDFKDSAGVCSFYCVNEYPPFTASEEKDYVVPEADAAGEEEGEQQEEEEGERQARGGGGGEGGGDTCYLAVRPVEAPGSADTAERQPIL